jgi:hypothetical protein
MSWIRFFRRSRWDAERARELQAYLEIEIDENIARGMVPDEARYAAHRKLGNATLVREEIYQMNTSSVGAEHARPLCHATIYRSCRENSNLRMPVSLMV